MTERAAVGNASDEGQVSAARITNKSDADLLKIDWQRVLSTAEGQRVIWAILEYCNTFASVMSAEQLRMAHNSGRQDVGHFVMAAIDDARPQSLLEMMDYARKERESKKRPSRRQQKPTEEGRAITDTTEDADNAP